ncbi:alginate O-acetyltransferase AlgX-related protein [Lacrimispora sp. HJ-01]|uniref:alginate O-acetyltransferase AlgX-related protein n=2 Tax=unclassified Lacrimispora TaxID=2719232 RepID=UPI00384B88A9
MRIIMVKWKYVFIILNISIMLVFAVLFYTGISPQTMLSGVVVQNERPKREITTIMNGEFQTQYSNWFSDNFPFRTYLVKAYDQILFNTGSVVNGIKAGKDGNLFGENFTNQSLVGTLDEEQVKNYAENLKLIQEELEARGKVFVYLITPSKAEIFPEDLPWNYKAAYNCLNETANIRRTLIKDFDECNINYLDFTKLTLQLKNNGDYPVFYRTGIHWSQYATSQALMEMLNFIEDKSSIDIPHINLSYQKIENAEWDEQDYLKLLNLYYSNYEEDYYTANIELNENNIELKRAFAMSTSFSHSLVNLFQKSNMPFSYLWRSQYTQFQDKLYLEGNHTKWEGSIPGVAIDDMNFDDIVNQSDIIYIENNACELPQSHIDFVHYLSAYLSQQQ